MVVLGIDPGSYVTGYAFLSTGDKGVRVLEYGSIACKTNVPFEDRLLHIITELEVLLEQHKPQVLSMESAFFAKNVKSAMILGHVRGAILVTCKKRNMSFAEYSPRSVKLAVTGSGASSKERVAQMVQTHLRLKQMEGPLDASDALAIAWTQLAPPPVVAKAPKHKGKNDMRKLILKMGGTLP